MTSQPLGSLPPGYAATKQGYASYVALVGDLGLIALGIGYAQVFLIIGSIGVFIIVSIAVIAGEVVTYRMLKR